MQSIRVLTAFVGLILLSSQVSARKPAVEDFVGIETEHPTETPQGTEGLFNFEQDMHKFEEQKKSPQLPTNQNSNDVSASTGFQVFTWISLLTLPMMIWIGLMRHLKQKASKEMASNIAVLDEYRKQKGEAKPVSEKKAS